MLTAEPAQDSYSIYMKSASVGQLGTMANNEIDWRIADVPDISEGVPGKLAFGLAVSQGTSHGDKSVSVGQISGGVFVGIVVADVTAVPGNSNTPIDGFRDGDNVGILALGDIWVAPTTDAVVAGHPVYFNSETGDLGDSTIDNDVLIVGARWIDSLPNTEVPLVDRNGLARVRLGIMA